MRQAFLKPKRVAQPRLDFNDELVLVDESMKISQTSHQNFHTRLSWIRACACREAQ